MIYDKLGINKDVWGNKLYVVKMFGDTAIVIVPDSDGKYELLTESYCMVTDTYIDNGAFLEKCPTFFNLSSAVRFAKENIKNLV